ncbi:MAG TPA: FtsX-like permease family protein [Puia sp.]|uniref:ABC transporter permease n=1 Tax=Puia sp. TaxID=2045100 RepID=UPI002C1BCDAB|nr:FtsX-like permease family protein [Puia sp.]HVU95969.1 FtsX-like permease family protein [Puia sp.]
MFRNYFITAIRNFWRNKVFSFINIIGLAIGISASLVIFLLVQHDFSFDKFEKDGARIYRVVNEGENREGKWHGGSLAEPMGAAVKKDVPGLEIVAPFRTLDETRITIPYPDANHPLVLRKQKDLVVADENFLSLVGYSWLAGSNATATQHPYQVVLTEKNAHLYFAGLQPAQIIGKPIIFDDTIQCTVTGVVRDLPGNSDFYFGTIISRPTYYTARLKPQGFGMWGWTNSADQLFVKLGPNTKEATVNAQLTKILNDNEKPDPKDHVTQTSSLQPLSNLHFNLERGVFDNSRQAHKPTLYYLLAVAAFLLLLACINFINLTTAQASQRAKEIGIRKTLGSQRRQLTIQFLTETFVLTLLATVLSIILIPFLLQVFADFIPADFHFDLLRQPQVIGFLALLILAVTVLSGIYPALILSGFKPIGVLKNQAYANTGKTRSAWLRKTLTVSQFVIAQVFIIGTLLVTKQISYAINKDLGFKRDAIITFRTNYSEEARKRFVLLEKLKTIPGVAMISLSSNPPSSNGTWTSTMTFNDGKKEIRENVEVKLADSNYFRLYGLRLVAGSSPLQSDTTNEVVINEKYLHILGYQDPKKIIGRQVEWNHKPTIVGVVADFHPRSVREAIKPLLIANGTNNANFRANVFGIALRPRNADGSNWTATLAAIQKAYREVYPNDDYDYQFVDETIAKFYTAEKNISKLLMWATGLTIFISCLGLLGLVIYITNQRTKEIGVRKVIGATVTQLILLLSKDFLKLIGLAILIALPISWWGSRKWLENFAYKTNLSWWVFAAGGATLLLIALIILTIRTLRSALANPVKALRSE